MPRHDVPDIFLNATALRAHGGAPVTALAALELVDEVGAQHAVRHAVDARGDDGVGDALAEVVLLHRLGHRALLREQEAGAHRDAGGAVRERGDEPAAVEEPARARSPGCRPRRRPAGRSNVVGTGPVWPPPSPPCTITASAPHAATFSAWRRAPIDGTTAMPASFSVLIVVLARRERERRDAHAFPDEQLDARVGVLRVGAQVDAERPVGARP